MGALWSDFFPERELISRSGLTLKANSEWLQTPMPESGFEPEDTKMALKSRSLLFNHRPASNGGELKNKIYVKKL